MMRRAAAIEWWAVGIWAASRVIVLGVAVVALGGLAVALDQVEAWRRWDAVHLGNIAHYGYDGNPAAEPDPGLRGFFPGMPLLMRLLYYVVPNWTLVGLLISLVASLVAAVALVRLGEAEGPPGTGIRATAMLFVSPLAVFLTAGYTEALFLAFALPAWLNARRGRWWWAGILAALATTVRITGVFLAAGLVVMFVAQILRERRRRRFRRKRGRHTARRAMTRAYALMPDNPEALQDAASNRRSKTQVIALGLPVIPLAAFGAYLWSTTGDWLAWLTAQQQGWGREFTWPWEAFQTTLEGAISGRDVMAFRLELIGAAVGVALCVLLLMMRRFDELMYVGTQLAALMTSSYYLSIPRSALLWWPLWLLLARLLRHPVAFWLFIAASTPLMGYLLAIFLREGAWVG